MVQLNQKRLDIPEKMIMLQSGHRVREHGDEKAKLKNKGDVVTVSGLGKAELYYRKLAKFQNETDEESEAKLTQKNKK